MSSRRFVACVGAFFAGCVLVLARPADGGLIYDVSVGTAAIQGTPVFVDLQYNPGGVGTLASSATITSFATDATGMSLNTTDGDVGGSLLPGPLTINNTFALNDLLENATFGTSLQFVLTLSGPGVSSPDTTSPGSSFGLSLFDSNFNPLLTVDPAATVLTINLNSDGSTIADTFPSDNSGSAPVAEAVIGASSGVPEPTTALLLISGACAIGIRTLAKKRKS